MKKQKSKHSYIDNLLTEGAAMVDVGAFIGEYATYCSELVGESGMVIAFEPIKDNNDLLDKFASFYNNIIVFKAAISSEKGEIKMFKSKGNAQDNRLFEFDDAEDYETVSAIRLDDLEFDRLDLLKISAQGYEDFVLQGAKEVIQKFRPSIIIDFNPELIIEAGNTPSNMLAYYDDLGYFWNFVEYDDQTKKGKLLLISEVDNDNE